MRPHSGVLFMLSFLILTPSAAANDFEAARALIEGRLKADYLTQSVSNVKTYLERQSADGTWPDIDYQDQSRSLWKPAIHMERLASISVAWARTDGPWSGKDEAIGAVHKGLDAWFRLKLKASNWWFNTIGIPQQIMRILVLTNSALSADERTRLLALLPDPDHVPASVATGQNLVWHASEQLVRGVMKPDFDDISAASRFLQKDIRLSQEEGIQVDGSFHQHGPQLYNGGYGFGFIQDASFYAQLLGGTPWAFSPEKLDLLAFLLLDGDRKMIRGVWLDDAVRGREPSRPGGSATAIKLAQSADRLAALVPARAGELQQFSKLLKANAAVALRTGEDQLPADFWTGDTSFWRSDYLSHAGAGWFASVRMTSARTIGTELINGENLRGEWQPFGALRVSRTGKEYDDILPVWDSARVPGVTAPHRVTTLTKTVNQSTHFVGSVSNGRWGLAAMDLDYQTTKAHKVWFFFDQGVLAAGSGISSAAEEPIDTTVNQTHRDGPVLVDGKRYTESGEHQLGTVRSVWHDNTLYVFDSQQKVSLSTGPASGSWHDINHDQSSRPLNADLFCLWIDHGVKPVQGSYSWVTLPGASPEAAAAWTTQPPVKVTLQNESVTAVHDQSDRIWAVAFWKPGKALLATGEELVSDRACLVLLSETDGKLWVSDPAQGSGSVALVWQKGSIQRQAKVDLPSGGGKEGSSVQARFSL